MATVLNKSNVFVLYHANCTDGTGAKYAAWKKFGDDGANYLPVNYGQNVPDGINQDSEVYILDFSYPRDVLEGLQKRCKSVVVLDHHKTAEEALRGLEGCHFDMHKSGAVLAWEYFHPETPVPQLLLHVQDRDLWQWKMHGTKEVLVALNLHEGDLYEWDNNSEDVQYLLRKGSSISEYNNLQIKNKFGHVASVPFFVDGDEMLVGVVNSTELASELGNAICLNKELKVDFAIVYSLTKYGEALLSLRSVGDFDVSNIAKAFGGGGHKNAAGAKISFTVLDELLQGLTEVYFDSECNFWGLVR